MNPELDRLLTALWTRDTARPAERPGAELALESVIEEIVSCWPGLTRQRLLDLVSRRYEAFAKAQLAKHPTVPPKA